jgi:hypothetical protein
VDEGAGRWESIQDESEGDEPEDEARMIPTPRAFVSREVKGNHSHDTYNILFPP